MNPSIKQLKASIPTRDTKPQGFWLPYAWLVRSIVEQSKGGRVVSSVVRSVLADEGLPLTATNERTLRVAYYGIRDKEWPTVAEEKPEIRGILKLLPKPEPPDEEQFALDEELRLELEREISEGFIPDPEE
jgi:hypothetical protein